MKKILIISPFFPPLGGSGVYRLQRWTKYLPEFQIQPIVVHLDHLPGEPQDESLLKELPPEVIRYPVRYIELSGREIRKLFRSKKDQPGSFSAPSEKAPGIIRKLLTKVREQLMIPDSTLPWCLFALPALKKIIKEHQPKLLLTTSPPETSHLLGLWVKRNYHLPWIADFRDLWNAGSRTLNLIWPISQLEKKLEKSVVLEADLLLGTNRYLKEMLSAKAGLKSLDKFLHLGPAEDLARFDAIPASEQKYDLLYTGYLDQRYPLEFFPALKQLNQIRKQKGEEPLRMAIAGKVSGTILEFLREFTEQGWLNLLGYLPMREAISLLKSARVLVLLHPEEKGWVPGKSAQYRYSGKPVLAVGGDQELKDLLFKHERIIFAPNDRQKLPELIEQALLLKEAPRSLPKELTAKGQAEIIAELVERLTKTPKPDREGKEHKP